MGSFSRKKRGISTIVVTVLLTVIGIAAVVLFWYIIMPTLYRLDFEIVNVKLQIIGDKKVAQIEIWNTGSIDITSLTVNIDSKSLTLEGEIHIRAGDKVSFVSTKPPIEEGATYIIKVRAEGVDRLGGKRVAEKFTSASVVKV